MSEPIDTAALRAEMERLKQTPDVRAYHQAKARLKAKIEANVQGWHEIAGILIEIKESEDWRQEFATWKEFCEKCSEFTLRHVNALISDEIAHRALLEILEETGRVFPPFTQETVHEFAQLENSKDRVDAVMEATENGTKPAKKKAAKAAVEKRAKGREIEPEKTDNTRPAAPEIPEPVLDDLPPAATHLPVLTNGKTDTRSDSAKYQELILSVERVFPNETRHQTALRYIREAEFEPSSNAVSAGQYGR